MCIRGTDEEPIGLRRDGMLSIRRMVIPFSYLFLLYLYCRTDETRYFFLFFLYLSYIFKGVDCVSSGVLWYECDYLVNDGTEE